jgi:hypothetical protein
MTSPAMWCVGADLVSGRTDCPVARRAQLAGEPLFCLGALRSRDSALLKFRAAGVGVRAVFVAGVPLQTGDVGHQLGTSFRE